jgi:RNA polymerase sigma factor for flagellar operon FliA
MPYFGMNELIKQGASMKNLATEQVWQEYQANANPQLRQELTLRYLGLVKYVVRKMIKNFPQAIEEQDLYHIGVLGLVEALDRYNPGYGIKFETYAIPRIKGSIIDELRKLDWIPRSLRSKSNMLKEKTVELDQKFSGEYTDVEVANGLGIEVNDLHHWRKDINSINMLSLDKPIDDANKQNLYDMVEVEDKINADSKMEEEEMKRILLKAIKKLPEKTRLAITLYYYEKLTFKEIGKILNVSESRISQIHSETMLRLKKEMTRMIYA